MHSFKGSVREHRAEVKPLDGGAGGLLGLGAAAMWAGQWRGRRQPDTEVPHIHLRSRRRESG